MKMWEAIQLLEEGKKVRSVAWEKGMYIWKNDEGEYVTEEGISIMYLNGGALSTEWEVYEERKDVALAWRIMYKKITEAEEFVDDYLNSSYLCSKYECHDCVFEKACCAFYNLFEILGELNKEYKLDVKHEYEN